MPSKFLNADDTVDLIKYGLQKANLEKNFDKVNDISHRFLIGTTANNQETTINMFVTDATTINIDWGDGTVEEKTTTNTYGSQQSYTHTYTNKGNYIIVITEGEEIPVNGVPKGHILFGRGTGYPTITPVEIVKRVQIKLKSITYNTNGGCPQYLQSEAFKDCVNLEKVTFVHCSSVNYDNNDGVFYTLRPYVFYNCINLQEVDSYSMSRRKTPLINVQTGVFNFCKKLKKISNLEQMSFCGSSIFVESSNSCLPNSLYLNYQGQIPQNDNSISPAISASYDVSISGEYETPDVQIIHEYPTLSIGTNCLGKYPSVNNITIISTTTLTLRNQALGRFFQPVEIHIKCSNVPTLSGTLADFNSSYVIYVPKGTAATYKAASGWSTYAANIVEEGAFDKLSTTGGALTGDVTTTNTTFTNTSLVTKQYVDDTIANLNANSTQY